MARQIDYVKSGDLWIAYSVQGEGELDVVFVPGYVTNLDASFDWPSWARFNRGLAAFSRVISFDKRGTGLSDREGTFLAFEDVMQDIRAVMDAVGSKRAALFGVAEGGSAGALFAATYPEATSALVLFSSFARRAWTDDYPWGLSPDVQSRVVETYEREWGRRPIGIRGLTPSLADDPRYQDFCLRVQRAGVGPSGALAWARMTLEIDIRDVLPAIRVPTLVMHRKGDRAVDIGNGRFLAEHIPGARLVELEGSDGVPYAGDLDAVLGETEEFLTGHRGRADDDRVLATILFTDIVGSTRQAAELGDRRWRDLLDEHDAIVRAELVTFGGREVKTIGDGFLATFDGPARAIRCACSAVRAVAVLGIELRAGLHTGECERREGDVGGMAVHIAARVTALAAPGEVLVSSTVKDLVVGSGIRFSDHGLENLKGVAEKWHLYSVDRDRALST